MNLAQTLQETVFRASVDNPTHRSLEEDVTDYLHSLEFITCSANYYESFPKEAVDILKNRFTLTSLYIRGRSDKLAIHGNKEVEFEYELKTKDINLDFPYASTNLYIEIWPLIHHISESRLGVRCLYVFRINWWKTNEISKKKELMNKNEGGFWVSEIPKIYSCAFTSRGVYDPIKDQMKECINREIPGITTNDLDGNWNGSGDPFIGIPKIQYERLIDWRILIEETIEDIPI